MTYPIIDEEAFSRFLSETEAECASRSCVETAREIARKVRLWTAPDLSYVPPAEPAWAIEGSQP